MYGSETSMRGPNNSMHGQLYVFQSFRSWASRSKLLAAQHAHLLGQQSPQRGSCMDAYVCGPAFPMCFSTSTPYQPGGILKL